MKAHNILVSPLCSSLTGRCLLVAGLLGLGACDSAPIDTIEPPMELRSGTMAPDPSVSAVGVGDGTSCVVTDDGKVKCWGQNEHGQLGQDATIDTLDGQTPDTVPFVDLGGPAQDVHTNGTQTVVLMVDGSVRVLGWGNDQPVGSEALITTLDLGGPAAALTLGSDFGCARMLDGGIRCWGANDHGQLGQTLGSAAPSVNTVAVGGDVIDLSAGAQHACAVLDTGAVRCWGRNTNGQLGYGHTSDIFDPATAGDVPLGGSATQVATGAEHTCARLDTGAARCWGRNAEGQLGYGMELAVGSVITPAAAGDVPVGSPVQQLVAGAEHTCAVVDGGNLRCWGNNDLGQLGRGDTESIGDNETPAGPMLDLGTHDAQDVFAGPTSHNTFVRLDDGGLRSWGDNDVGQLGHGELALVGDEPSEIPGGLPDIVVRDDDDDS